MSFLSITMLISIVLWCLSVLFFIYALGMLFLHWNWQLFLLSIAVGIVANGFAFLMGILND
jgi:hypothetical protein